MCPRKPNQTADNLNKNVGSGCLVDNLQILAMIMIIIDKIKMTPWLIFPFVLTFDHISFYEFIIGKKCQYVVNFLWSCNTFLELITISCKPQKSVCDILPLIMLYFLRINNNMLQTQKVSMWYTSFDHVKLSEMIDHCLETTKEPMCNLFPPIMLHSE